MEMSFSQGELAHRPWWFWVPDLPFSLVADKGILPLTLGQTLAKLAGLSPTGPPVVPAESCEPADDQVEWPELLRF